MYTVYTDPSDWKCFKMDSNNNFPCRKQYELCNMLQYMHHATVHANWKSETAIQGVEAIWSPLDLIHTKLSLTDANGVLLSPGGAISTLVVPKVIV